MKIKNYKFEKAENFKYLGVILNEDNNNQIDLQERIKNANKTYFMLKFFFKNKNISKKLKLRLKNTIMDKTFTYASETWILTKTVRKQLKVFERKVYRRILDPVNDNEKENWRILTNKEIYASVKKPTIIETIRLNRLQWSGHVQNMEENRIPKRVLYMPMATTRLTGRPRNRWQDEVREEWKKLLRMARNCCILHMPMEWMNEWIPTFICHSWLPFCPWQWNMMTRTGTTTGFCISAQKLSRRSSPVSVSEKN